MVEPEDIESLQSALHDLEQRIRYIESELEMSLQSERFRREMEHRFGDADEVDVSETDFGYHAFVRGISADVAQKTINRYNDSDELNCTLIENGNGLGLEIWTTDRNI